MWILSRAVATDRSAAGFTIIEALIALAVVTICIVAISSLMGSTARGVRQLESHVSLVQAANNVLVLDLPRRAEAGNVELTGQSMDHHWRMQIEPVFDGIEAPTADALWLPQRVKLRVQAPSGASLDLETIRLFRRPGK
jgi:general secretion pathway protein I